MSRRIEELGRHFLLSEFCHSKYEFAEKGNADRGFDLWLIDKADGARKKVELKVSTSSYQRPSNLFERLVFNAEIERDLFESGESVIARVFTGAKPFRVFIVTNAVLGSGASLISDARYVMRGKLNYQNSFTELA